MRRILLIFLLAVMLLPAPPMSKPESRAATSLLVRTRALPGGSAQVGLLRMEGAWILDSDNPGFGGISSMLVDGGGRILALSDSGTLIGIDIAGPPGARSFIAPLPVRPQDRDKPWWTWDSEAMTHDPASDRYWVGFELQQPICRYAPGFARVEACRAWPEISAWPKTGSLESLARLPDGRFIAIAEMGMTREGDHETLLFAGDPAEEATPAPLRLRYAPPRGYRPTDAVAIDDRHLLVLNRRLALSDLFTATLSLVDLPAHMAPGTRLTGRTLAQLAPPLPSDNFEALAVSHDRDRITVWIMSDDNHEFFQRSLLLKFALPRSALARQ
ncbi:MAG: esterase-like activity of phytase family protein [Sphingobium sp.]